MGILRYEDLSLLPHLFIPPFLYDLTDTQIIILPSWVTIQYCFVHFAAQTAAALASGALSVGPTAPRRALSSSSEHLSTSWRYRKPHTSPSVFPAPAPGEPFLQEARFLLPGNPVRNQSLGIRCAGGFGGVTASRPSQGGTCVYGAAWTHAHTRALVHGEVARAHTDERLGHPVSQGPFQPSLLVWNSCPVRNPARTSMYRPLSLSTV